MGKKKPERLPHSTLHHQQSIDHAVALAMALPPHAIRARRRSVETLLRDARTVAAAAALHEHALVARGLNPALTDELVARADALSQAQALWLGDRSRGLRANASSLLLREAESLRNDALALLTLALRRSCDGQERLLAVTGGEGIAELIADLRAMTALANSAEQALADINEDASSLAKELSRARKRVEQAVADDELSSIVSPSKDIRDRLAVLVEDAIDEIRAFALVAFRTDPTTERRGAFAIISRG